MAKKITTKKRAASNNGNGARVKSSRKDFEGASSYVATAYPALFKAANAVAQQFEVVSPDDARFVSGYLRMVITAKAKERLSEHAAFMTQRKGDRIAAQIAKLKTKALELERLQKELLG